MSLSKLKLKQELHYKSEKSKVRGYQYGPCSVYRMAPDKVVLEVSEDPPRKDIAQVISVGFGKHDDIVRVTTTDDIKYVNFPNREDMQLWFHTIKGLMQTCDLTQVDFVDDIGEGRPRAQTFLTRPRFLKERDTRKVKTSPATPDDMFHEMTHSKKYKDLKPISPDDDSPYVNEYFNPDAVSERDAYQDKHALMKLQGDNYQPLTYSQDEYANLQGQEVAPVDDDDDSYEYVADIPPSRPLPLSSRQHKPPVKLPQKQAGRKAPLPFSKPKKDGVAKQLPARGPRPQIGTKSKMPEKDNSNPMITQQPNIGPLVSQTGSIISHHGTLHSRDHNHRDRTQEQCRLLTNPHAVVDENWTRWREPSDEEKSLPRGDTGNSSKRKEKGRRPMPPPKHTKPTAQVRPHVDPASNDGIIYDEVPIEYGIGNDGLEEEAKCVPDLPKSGGSVSRLEEKMTVRIPVQEYKVGDISLADRNGTIVIERSKISYLNPGDQILQIGDIDVEHLAKEFANTCLHHVTTNEIKLVISRHYH